MTFPLQQPVEIFLLVLLIILLGPLLFRRLKIPNIVGMIIAGMVVGPYGLNLLERDDSFRIFGEVGILYIMFLAAVEIDMYHLRKQSKKGVIFGLLSFGLPMLFGIFGSHYAFGVGWTSSVLIASMYASHTLVSYPIVSKFGLSNSKAPVIAVVGTIVAVLLALLSLAEVVKVRVNGSFSWSSLILLLAMMAVYTIGIGFAYPWLTRRFFRRFNDSVSQFIFILALVFIASLLAHVIGLEAILGAFFAGLVLNRLIPGRSALMGRIKFVGDAIFIPYFLIGVGMLINVGVIVKGWGVAWVATNMIALALGAKWLAAFISQKLFSLDSTDRLMMFGLTSGKAAATIAATMIGYNYGLLSENVMNGAVLMILVCCIVSTLSTEHAAKKLRMRLTDEEINRPVSDRLEDARQLVAVSNPVTAEGIMKMAVLMRSIDNHLPVVTLFVRNDDDTRRVSMGRRALATATAAAMSVDLETKDIERYDINVVSGVTNVVKEQDSTDIIIGLHRKSNVVDTFYGAMIEQLLSATDRMVIMSRCFVPVDTIDRLVVVVPRNAEYETGFRAWVERLGNLASQLGCRMIVIAYASTSDFVKGVIEGGGFGVRLEFRWMESWDDFILLSGDIGDEDLMVVIGARKGSISFSSELETLPSFLSRHFSTNNLVVIYPKQF